MFWKPSTATKNTYLLPVRTIDMNLKIGSSPDIEHIGATGVPGLSQSKIEVEDLWLDLP